MAESIVVDGITVSNAHELADLLRRQLRSSILSGKTSDEGPEEAIWRLFNSIRGSSSEQLFVDALMELLIDADVAIRTSAVGLAQDFSESLEPRRLLKVLDENQSLFRGVRPKADGHSGLDDSDLSWGLLRAVAGRRTSDDKVLNRLRTAAEDPTNGATILAGLTVSDPEWVLGNLAKLLDQAPGGAAIVLNNLDASSSRDRFASEARKAGRRGKAAAVKAVKDLIRDPRERQRLLNLLASS